MTKRQSIATALGVLLATGFAVLAIGLGGASTEQTATIQESPGADQRAGQIALAAPENVTSERGASDLEKSEVDGFDTTNSEPTASEPPASEPVVDDSPAADTSASESSPVDSDTSASDPLETRIQAIVATEYSCPDGAGELDADNEVCNYNETSLVAAIVSTQHHCLPNSVATYDGESGELVGCSSGAGSIEVPAIEDKHYQCPSGTGPEPTLQLTCQHVVESVEMVPADTSTALVCPDDAPAGAPTAENPFCLGTRPVLIASDAFETMVPGDCPEGWVVHYATTCSQTTITTVSVPAQTIQTVVCPDNAKPSGLGCVLLTTGATVRGRTVVEYSCGDIGGAYGQPTAADPTCFVDESSVSMMQRPSEIHYVCAESSEQDPDDEQTCWEEGSETFEAFALVLTTYDCPPGSTGSPSAQDPTCEKVTLTNGSVPVDIITTYLCPRGSSGTPTAANPVCDKPRPGAEQADPIETINYTCPDAATGEPSASNPTCQVTAGVSGAALETISYSCPPGSSGNPTAAAPTCILDTA